ncbi:MAG: hypothetical protein KatS3mg032_2096 [Cyclobacteriaceae bacterium]|nr:MAG: hypothetical protein KatS3mg032_2096 [Cyclobacteriaceae bacterium]
MKRSERLIKLLLPAICCVICCGRKEEVQTLNWTLNLKDSLAIPVNNETNVQASVQLIRLGEREWLSSYQYIQGVNRFYWYSLEGDTLNRVITIPAEGPGGTGRLSPVMGIVKENDLLVYQVNANRFYITDTTGGVKQRFDLADKVASTILSTHYFLPGVVNNKLRFFVLGSYHPNSREFLERSKAEGMYDLITGHYSNTQPRYPDYPRGYELSLENWKVSRCVNGLGITVYTFPFDSHLHVYDTLGRHMLIKVPNPDRPERVNRKITDPMNQEEQFAFLATTGLYSHILYDQFRKIYFRIFLMPCPAVLSDGTTRRPADFPWRLEIFNGDFELKGVVYFESGKYNPYQLLVSQRGLLISKVNPYRPNQEDFLKYDVYAIAPI